MDLPKVAGFHFFIQSVSCLLISSLDFQLKSPSHANFKLRKEKILAWSPNGDENIQYMKGWAVPASSEQQVTNKKHRKQPSSKSSVFTSSTRIGGVGKALASGSLVRSGVSWYSNSEQEFL